MTSEIQRDYTFCNSPDGLEFNHLLTKLKDFELAIRSLDAPERRGRDNTIFLVEEGVIVGFYSDVEVNEPQERVIISPLLAVDIRFYRLLVKEILKRHWSGAIPIQVANRPDNQIKKRALIENQFKQSDCLIHFHSTLETARIRANIVNKTPQNVILSSVHEISVLELKEIMNDCLESVNTVPILSEQMIESIINDNEFDRTASLVALLNDKIVGFILATVHGEIDAIGVRKNFRLKGIGKLLLTESLRRMNCEEVTAQVLLSNTPSMELFKATLKNQELEYNIYIYD